MITVRAHNKRTGEVTVMRVRKGTPMKEVMARYAESHGVRAERLSWKRRTRTAVTPVSPDQDCVDCGCTGY